MYSEARKLHLIEELLRTKSESVLAEVEAVLKRAAKPIKAQKLSSNKYPGSSNLTEEQRADFQDQISKARDELKRDIKKKPSEFFGSISEKQGDKLHAYLNESREEWQRDI